MPENELDVEDQIESFMRQQAELESGAAFNRVRQPDVVLGSDKVSDEQANQYCQDIVEALRKLEVNREMSYNEVKLTIAIDDPRTRAIRRQGIETESGISRDEMAAALTEVRNGKVPNDRIALKVLWEEMINWPALDTSLNEEGNKERNKERKYGPPQGNVAASGWREGQARPPIGRDESETPQSLADMLPEWMGYSYVYLVSAVPIFIGLGVVVVLFVNSLK